MTCENILAILILSLFTTLSAATPISPPPSFDVEDHSFFSHTALLAPILSHLGFNELSMAAPSLASDTTAKAWSGPSTLFAPSDSSLRSCFSCSVPNLLREHIVPGLFTIEYLRKLPFGTKIKTLSPGRCITVSRNNATSSSAVVENVFVGGVEITHPDLFNNGVVVIHGIQGYISPLSPLSCDFERLNTLSFPHYSSAAPVDARAWNNALPVQPVLMLLMMRDAMLRLRNNGFGILSVAMRVKYGELVGLSNFTVFAVDDVSIFSGSHSYINSIRLHIVPNQYLTMSDLEKLPVGSRLSTLERGESLVVTGGGESGFGVRINYVRVKVGEVVKNMKIVVHSVDLGFPRINGIKGVYSVGSYDGMSGGVNMEGGSGFGSSSSVVEEGGCLAESAEEGTCATTGTTATPTTTSARTLTITPMPNVKPTPVDTDDHYGL